jgi:hypothetical protein
MIPAPGHQKPVLVLVEHERVTLLILGHLGHKLVFLRRRVTIPTPRCLARSPLSSRAGRICAEHPVSLRQLPTTSLARRNRDCP